MADANKNDILLEVKNLKKYFKTPKGMLHAVDNVSFTLGNERVALVGESGSGKSMTARALMVWRLLPCSRCAASFPVGPRACRR